MEDGGGSCGEQARHVGTRGTTLLFVAKPANHIWAQKASKDLWQQGNQCFPVLGVSIIYQCSESMNECKRGSCLSSRVSITVCITLVRRPGPPG